MDFDGMCEKLCEAERDRLTTAEICIDEALTIMDRHGVPDLDPHYQMLLALSGVMDRALTNADGLERRRRRLMDVRRSLTEAFPLSDADLGAV